MSRRKENCYGKKTSSYHRPGRGHPPGPYRAGKPGRRPKRACAASPPSPSMTTPPRRCHAGRRGEGASTPPACWSKKEIRRMDRFAQFAVAAAAEAMADSGPGPGAGGQGPDRRRRLQRHRRHRAPSRPPARLGESRGFDRVSPFFIPMVIANMAAGHIAIRFGLHGHVHLPGDRLRRRRQRGGRRLPPHPGRLRRGDGVPAAPRPPSRPWPWAASPP